MNKRKKKRRRKKKKRSWGRKKEKQASRIQLLHLPLVERYGETRLSFCTFN